MSIAAEVLANPNSFFGTYNHFQRLGWYFDKIVETTDNLKDQDTLRVMTGRFVYVEREDAIFLRTEGTYSYIRYKPIEYYNENDELVRVEYSNVPDPINTVGFRFIGYLTQHARLLLDKDGMFFDIDKSNFTFPYKIANDEYVKRISAYYFPTDNNSYVFDDSKYSISPRNLIVKLNQVVRLRSKPNNQASLVVEQDLLPSDHYLYPVIGESADHPNWYQVDFNNNIGWIYKKYTSTPVYLKLVSFSGDGSQVIDQIPVREEPNTDSDIQHHLQTSNDTYYEIINISKNRNWYKIKYLYEENNQLVTKQGWVGKIAVEIDWDDERPETTQEDQQDDQQEDTTV